MSRRPDHDRARELNARDRRELAKDLRTAAVYLELGAERWIAGEPGMPSAPSMRRVADWLRDEAARWER